MATKIYGTDPDPSTVEGSLIRTARLNAGDYGKVAPVLSTDLMWVILLQATRNVAVDINDFAFVEPDEDFDFVIDPIPTPAQKRLIGLNMVAEIREGSYSRQGADGMGARIKAGLDSIDTGKTADVVRDLHDKAQKAYKSALIIYNARKLVPVDIDLYKVDGSEDTLEIN